MLSLSLFMCQDQEPDVPLKGKVNFGMVPASTLPSGRLKTIIVDEAIVTIEKASGELVYEGSLSLTSFGESYISEQLELEEGDYQLTKFILTQAGMAKYATPLVGSPKADLVENPLPISFSIELNQVTKLTPEVVAVGNNSPGVFGYVEFDFEIVEEIEDASADTYIVGYEGNKAMLWKNGVPTVLSEESSTARDIVVMGDDVYISGSINKKAVYWKNGVPVFLPSEYQNQTYFSTGEVIAISGNDVYVAGDFMEEGGGSNSELAGYWKNGELFIVGSSWGSRFLIRDIDIEGTDVYIAGSEQAFSNPYYELEKAVYWKNGTKYILSSSDATSFSRLHNIEVSGNDLIAIGQNNGQSAIWNNGLISDPDDFIPHIGESPFRLQKGCIVNNQIYATGVKYLIPNKRDRAAILKPDRTDEAFIDEGVSNSYGYDIDVIDNNVFVCGFAASEDDNLEYRAMYWKNSKGVFLTDGTLRAIANSIYVVRK